MNINQRLIILTNIQEIEKLDVEQLVVKAYPNQKDMKDTIIGNYNAAELISMLKKMIKQLKIELEDGLGLFLPNMENFNNDYGNITLDIESGQLLNYIRNSQFKNVENLVVKFVYYQILYGFWDRSKIKAHPLENERIFKQQELIELNQKNFDSNVEVYNTLKQNLDNKLNEVTKFLSDKQKELANIPILLNQANSQVTQINTIAANSKNKETEITGILNNLNEKVKTVVNNITEYKSSFTNIQTDSTKLSEQLKKDIADAFVNLDDSKKKIEFIESKREEIVRLTGMAADGSLGSKFEQRQLKLDRGLRFWRWAVPIMTILSVVWVVVVFTCISAKIDNEWVRIGVNLLKTAPGFILLGFVFGQYSKERNLQEEYAFKSAIAMTLTTYSELIKQGDDKTQQNRQNMLLRSIEQIYKQPKIHPEKSDRMFSFKSKHLSEAMQAIAESLKNIKH